MATIHKSYLHKCLQARKSYLQEANLLLCILYFFAYLTPLTKKSGLEVHAHRQVEFHYLPYEFLVVHMTAYSRNCQI